MPGAANVASQELARSQIDSRRVCLSEELSSRLGALCEYWYETGRFAQFHGFRSLEADPGPPNGCLEVSACAGVHSGASR